MNLNKHITMKKSTYLLALTLGISTVNLAQTVGVNTDGSDPDANTLLHLNNHSASSLDSALLRIENEKSASGTGVQIHNSGQAGTTAQWDFYIPGGSTDLRIKNSSTDYISIQNDGDVGIGTSTPASTLDINGSIGYKVTTITSATTLDNTHNIVLCNTGAYTVTLPAAAFNTGRIYYIKNIDTDGDYFTIDGNSTETIDGDETFELLAYNHAVRIVSDGSGWHVLEEVGKENKDISGCGTYFDFTWRDVTNPSTGLTWMDRNLGAQRVALSKTDDKAYGDYYQWGRAADGHQCRTSSTTATNSSDDTPGDALFITEGSSPYDWRSSQNDNLWQGVDGTNNPCPGGYRLPTETEIDNEHLTWSSDDYDGAFGSVLKLPVAGYRDENDGLLKGVGARGDYRSSTVSSTNSRHLYFGSSSANMNTNYRAFGFSVRCLKD
jgi:hypothetical protein